LVIPAAMNPPLNFDAEGRGASYITASVEKKHFPRIFTAFFA
jgi:hypothetical protein